MGNPIQTKYSDAEIQKAIADADTLIDNIYMRRGDLETTRTSGTSNILSALVKSIIPRTACQPNNDAC